MVSLERVVDLDRPQLPDCLLEGSSVVLTCNVEGLPFPSVTFLKDNVTIIPGLGEFTRVTRIDENQV